MSSEEEYSGDELLSSSSEEEIPVPSEKTFKNNEAGLLQSLADFENKDLGWIERLDVTASTDVTKADSTDLAQNDFARESMFYRLAQDCATEALTKLSEMDYPTTRPDDYFAQMAKTDVHMKKVRSKLLSKQASAERSEQAKKIRAMKKYGKKVQQDVLKKRQKEKRDTLETIKRYRKGQQDKIDFLQADRESKGKKQKMSKRDFKEQKYGFGGQKKRSKRPTAYSSANVNGLPKRKFMAAAKGNRNKRPGKNRRQKMKK